MSEAKKTIGSGSFCAALSFSVLGIFAEPVHAVSPADSPPASTANATPAHPTPHTGSVPMVGGGGSKGPPGNSYPTDAVSAQDLAALQKLHDAHQMEIQMGQLAQAKGSSKAVKEFGRKLASDHAKADKQIADFLKQRGLDLKALATTTSADPAHAATADQIGENFDRGFATQMLRDHQRTIEVVQKAARTTGDPLLKSIYQQTLETLKSHEQTARALAQGKGRV